MVRLSLYTNHIKILKPENLSSSNAPQLYNNDA